MPLDWQIPQSEPPEPAVVERALRERIKELNCLYGITRLAERYPNSLDQMLEGVVNILPPAWQYPEVTCAQIDFEGVTYRSGPFKETQWRLSSVIHLHDRESGEVVVYYVEERPPQGEGPFLREERVLLDAVAEHIGTIAMRVRAERELHESNRELTLERQALQEANIALRTVLARIEEEKRRIQADVESNVVKILMPIVDALAAELPPGKRQYVDLLRANLQQIVSPFVSQLSQRHRALTPTEIGICNMIRNGLGTKEIAQVRGVAPSTVTRHRERVRRKLGITNQSVNLRTYLLTLG